MISRGPDFLTVVWFGSSPPLTPLLRQQVFSLSQSPCVSPVERIDGKGGERVGEELNHTTASKPGPLKIIQYSVVQLILAIHYSTGTALLTTCLLAHLHAYLQPSYILCWMPFVTAYACMFPAFFFLFFVNPSSFWFLPFHVLSCPCPCFHVFYC